MEERQMHNLYNSMLESGELLEVFPTLTGKWEKDKKSFIREQEELEKLANITYIDLDEDADEY